MNFKIKHWSWLCFGLAITGTANATWLEGNVYCDANKSGSIEMSEDTVLPNVDVIISCLGGNVSDQPSGEFPSSSFFCPEPNVPFIGTTNDAGHYLEHLIKTADLEYSVMLSSPSLPDDATVILPSSDTVTFSFPIFEDSDLINPEYPHPYVAKIDWLVDSSICQEEPEPYCGDGIVDLFESCDDGNSENEDSCRNDCSLPICGDGIIDFDEACDDNNAMNNDECRNDCTLPSCGDGILDMGEECDAGSLNGIDGECSTTCTIEPAVCDLSVQVDITPDTFTPASNPSCEETGKPYQLTFAYTGGGCAASDNAASADGIKLDKQPSCNGTIQDSLAAYVRASGKKGQYDVTRDLVSPGERFTVNADKFDAWSTFSLSNSNRSEVHVIHTSCSAPLQVGDIFGSLTLVGINGVTAEPTEATITYRIQNNGDALTNVQLNATPVDHRIEILPNPLTASDGEQTYSRTITVFEPLTLQATVTGDTFDGQVCSAAGSDEITVSDTVGKDSCDDGKPIRLGITYVGGSCDDSNHTQNIDKTRATCVGDSSGEQPVILTVTNKKGEQYATQQVTIGETLVVDAAQIGRDRFDSETFVTITQGAAILQTINFHTSCSAPLIVGDQHGGIIVSSFEAGEDKKGKKKQKGKKKDKKPKGKQDQKKKPKKGKKSKK